MRKTKIVATLGPATSDEEAVFALIERGMNVARINASHGDHTSHLRAIQVVRAAAAKAATEICILYDLQGPKIRLGLFAGDGVRVEDDDTLRLAVGRPAVAGELPSDYPLLDEDVKVGHPLLIDDGNIACVVESVTSGLVTCRVEHGGLLLPRKGINLPATDVSAPAITEKDERDAIFAAEHAEDIDVIALSFVRRAEDVQKLRDLLATHDADIPIIAKIEKPQALDNLEDIMEASWGVMVARGDLGVELSPADVPAAQKRIIRTANRMGKPVITATQMLDSMTHNPRPTRAEASDVANAVLDGTDAVMLSAETATGKFPALTVDMMAKIVIATEAQQVHLPEARRREPGLVSTATAVADSCAQVTRHLDAKAVVVYTRTGRSAIVVAGRRITKPMIVYTPNIATQRRLGLLWGAHAFLETQARSVRRRLENLDIHLMQAKLAKIGDAVVLCMGGPTAPAGSTNIMMVHIVGET